MKNAINRDGLLKIHRTLTEKAIEVMKAKNHDYATDSDVFRNFRMFGGLGILVRLSDKLARLRSFEENGEFKVADEKLLDTILDLINYGIIYYAFNWEQTGDPGQVNGKGEAIIDIRTGPYCDDCGHLADYRSTVGIHWCKDCVKKYQFDTNRWDVLELA